MVAIEASSTQTSDFDASAHTTMPTEAFLRNADPCSLAWERRVSIRAVSHHDKMPRTEAARGRRPQSCLHQKIKFFLFHGFVNKLADASALADQRHEHDGLNLHLKWLHGHVPAGTGHRVFEVPRSQLRGMRALRRFKAPGWPSAFGRPRLLETPPRPGPRDRAGRAASDRRRSSGSNRWPCCNRGRSMHR